MIRDFIHKLRKYEIRIRKAVTGQMQGDFKSVFKGAGLEFSDVREYQWGDDVRTIDWNVSAKGHGTFVKTFREEKEQTVFLMVDVSGSQQIGSPKQYKADVCKEIAGVLALSAIREGSQVGLYCFSDQKEKYIKPGKGLKNAYTIISSLYNIKNQSFATNLSAAVFFVLNILRKRSVIILISDFIDEEYSQVLRAMARRHDLLVIQVADEREAKFPKVGIVPVLDKETNRTVWVNSSSPFFHNWVGSLFIERKVALENFCKKHQVNYLFVEAGKDFVPDLVRLFKVRNRNGSKKN